MKITLMLILIAVIAYGLGNVNGAIITSTHLFRRDIRNVGSGNAGLANFYRNFGLKGLALVFLIDFGKGFLAAAIGGWLLGLVGEGDAFVSTGKFFAMFCAILGHIYPALYRFHGGKGVLCGVACVFCIDWRAGVACMVVFCITIALSRYISLGSMLGTATFPIAAWALDYGGLNVLLGLICAVVIIFKHRENIMRIIRHKEPVFEFKKDVTHKLDEDL